jgi:hypothetical protein
VKSNNTFRATIGQWFNATEDQLTDLARGVCYAMAERVVDKTPVVDGFLRGSWQPSIGAPSEETGTHDKAGAMAMAKLAVVMTEFKLGDTFYMMNNANYAQYVEYGTSKMAGRHFVGDTVAAFDAVLAAEAADLGMKPA